MSWGDGCAAPTGLLAVFGFLLTFRLAGALIPGQRDNQFCRLVELTIHHGSLAKPDG